MQKARRAERGVTLVEMMIVVAIIGVLAVLVVGAPRGYGPTAQNVSEQLTTTMGFARMRAGATRRIHRVQLEPQTISVYQAPTTGLVTPTTGWQLVQQTTIKSGVTIWNAQAGAQVTTGATPSQDASLNYLIDFRPDGRATASTIFVTNTPQQSSKYRVLVYGATGGSYARQLW